jgi:hypothetical protein
MPDTLDTVGGVTHTAGGILETMLHGAEGAAGMLEAIPAIGGLVGTIEGIGGLSKAFGPHEGSHEEQHHESQAEAADGLWGMAAGFGSMLAPELSIPLGLTSLASEAAFGVGPGAALTNSWNGLNPDGTPSLAHFDPPRLPMTYRPDPNPTLPDREAELEAMDDPNNPFVKAALAGGAR